MQQYFFCSQLLRDILKVEKEESIKIQDANRTPESSEHEAAHNGGNKVHPEGHGSSSNTIFLDRGHDERMLLDLEQHDAVLKLIAKFV